MGLELETFERDTDPKAILLPTSLRYNQILQMNAYNLDKLKIIFNYPSKPIFLFLLNENVNLVFK